MLFDLKFKLNFTCSYLLQYHGAQVHTITDQFYKHLKNFQVRLLSALDSWKPLQDY